MEQQKKWQIKKSMPAAVFGLLNKQVCSIKPKNIKICATNNKNRKPRNDCMNF